MISLEALRTEVETNLKTLLDTYCSVYPPMWQNLVTIDLENLSTPFLAVEIDCPRTTRMTGLGTGLSNVFGEIRVSFLCAVGKGLDGYTDVSGVLLEHLSNREINAVVYEELRVLNVSPYPGIVGKMNIIPFRA